MYPQDLHLWRGLSDDVKRPVTLKEFTTFISQKKWGGDPMPLTATGEASGSGQEAGAGARGQPEPQLYWAFHGKSGAREFSIGSLE